MLRIPSQTLRDRIIDGVEERLDSYLQGRVYPWEIATTFNFVLYDEFSKLRLDPEDPTYAHNLEMWSKGEIPPLEALFRITASLIPVFTGEYIVDPKEPYQTRVYSHHGTEACSPIPIQRGVIGRAVRTGEDQYVPDVTKDPLHVGCDPTMEGTEVVLISWSEPYSSGDHKGRVVPYGVLDLDFGRKMAVSEKDAERLRRIWDKYGKLIFPGEAPFDPTEEICVRRAA